MSNPAVDLPNHPVYLPEWPPTQDELPYDDGEPMESWRHKCQTDLLISVTQTWLQPRSDGFVGGNMFLYYSLEQARSRNFKGPDYFVVLSVPYVPIEPDTEGRLKSEVLGLYLVKWQGSFRDIQTKWIRWATEAGELVPTEAEQEHQRAELAERRADLLAQKLRELGVDPGTLD
jgi:hypothetical protein